MAAATYDLNIEQGVHFTDTLILKDDQNAVIDLTGYTAAMQIRPYKSSSVVLVDGTSSNGVLVITPALGKIEIVLTEEQTSGLIYTESVYDLYLYDNTNKPTRLIEGTVRVSLRVTRS